MTERNTTHIKPKRKVSFWEITMTAPLLGLLLRIPLANIIGNEGNGYMALGWEIYFVFYSILCYGVKDAIRKMVVKRVKKSYYHNSRRVLIFGTLFSLFLGLVSGGVMYLLAIPIFHHFLQLKAGSIVFKILSLFIVVNSLTFGYQGFFEGSGSKIPTCFSKIIYTLIGGTGAIIFAIILSKYGAKVSALLFERQYTPGFGAAGIISGYLCGAIASVLFLFVILSLLASDLQLQILA